MDINLIKQKTEQIFNKQLFIKQNNIITDENNSFEIICNNNGSIEINNNHFNDYYNFIIEFSKLNSENQDEKYKAYVDLLEYDKRLKMDFEQRCELAKEGKYLDLLINDEKWQVRFETTKQAYKFNRVDFLEKLINDKDWHVRKEVVKQAYKFNRVDFIEQLVDDNDWHVRREVVIQAYKFNRIDLLEKLINDKRANTLNKN